METRRTHSSSAWVPQSKRGAASGMSVGTASQNRDVLATLSERTSFMTNGAGKTTHAVIPYDDYVYIIALQMAREAVPVLEDPNTEWIDGEELMASFAAPNIAAWRKKRGWTQKQLGAKLKMPQSQVARMEKTPGAITYKTLERVAKALGVATADLLK